MATRFFKVIHNAGAFIDGVHYPPATDNGDDSASIVALELGAKEKGPLWGVEVDANGNEIAERPDANEVSDKLATNLANKIATGAGAAPAGGNKQEAEQRKQTIADTLSLLDHSNDADWTTGGLPKVDVIATASGLEGLTREEITQANPDFKREVKTAE